MAFRTNKTPVLQTKSASGSVASFNTALAMPLPSCNIAVNAWQEGSGDPSPSNIRPIHGFSEVNATRAGKNLWPYDNLTGTRRISKDISLPIGSYVFSAICTSTDTDSNVCAFLFQYEDGTYSALKSLQRNARSSNTINLTKPVRFLYVYASNNDTTSVNDDFTFSDIQIELGSTPTAYEPYTGNTYTIQLGQEVYGAEVDVVNGVAHVTHGLVDLGDLLWAYGSGFGGYFYANISDIKPNSWENCSCEAYKNHIITGNLNSLPNYNFGVDDMIKRIYFKNYDYTDANDFKIAVAGVKLVYELATPIETQLTPTPISTIVGSNTIFADTGDIDITYKDLDIAKRGNFREVFKLPS